MVAETRHKSKINLVQVARRHQKELRQALKASLFKHNHYLNLYCGNRLAYLNSSVNLSVKFVTVQMCQISTALIFWAEQKIPQRSQIWSKGQALWLKLVNIALPPKIDTVGIQHICTQT